MNVLVTGATGYIGSHACVSLVEAGHRVVGLDNYANSVPEVADRVGQITGTSLPVHEIDLLDGAAVDKLFAAESFDAVVHFAGLKSVAESVAQPTRYYRVNVGSTLSLLDAMAANDVRRIVFSSSATVYGDTTVMPVTEQSPLGPINPYGQTKLDIENLLRYCAAADGLGVICLRYFNPVGAHPSGLIGEAPGGVPANLVPYMLSVASGERPELAIYGDDYPTPDGTCLRDYVHVQDLADAHSAALDAIALLTPVDDEAAADNEADAEGSWRAFNIGTGAGTSVLEALAAGEAAVGSPIAHRVTGRRAGDAPQCYADPSAAAAALGWRAKRSISDMFVDAWRWELRRSELSGL